MRKQKRAEDSSYFVKSKRENSCEKEIGSTLFQIAWDTAADLQMGNIGINTDFIFYLFFYFFFIFAPVKCAISIVSAFVGVSVGEKIAFRASFQFHEIRLSLHCIHLAAVISWRSDSCHRNLFNDKLYFLSPQLQMGVHVFALKRVL